MRLFQGEMVPLTVVFSVMCRCAIPNSAFARNAVLEVSYCSGNSLNFVLCLIFVSAQMIGSFI